MICLQSHRESLCELKCLWTTHAVKNIIVQPWDHANKLQEQILHDISQKKFWWQAPFKAIQQDKVLLLCIYMEMVGGKFWNG